MIVSTIAMSGLSWLTELILTAPPAASYAAATVTVGVLLVAGVWVVRSVRGASRSLDEYDLQLQQLCPRCGYDLRATVGRCSECGRVNSVAGSLI